MNKVKIQIPLYIQIDVICLASTYSSHQTLIESIWEWGLNVLGKLRI